MPRVAKKSRVERQLTITLTYNGSLFDAYDAARRVLDSGILQDAMHEYSASAATGHAFSITNAEVK